MGIFSKDAACDQCGATRSKKELNDFDPTWRRERRSHDVRRRLCSSCLPSVLREYFGAYSFRAVAIEPFTEEPAGYGFAPLDRVVRTWHWTEELKEQIRGLLPPEGASCSRCGATARFNWCGLDIFDGSPFEYYIRERGHFSERPLCGECAAAAFEDAFRNPKTALREVLPPADGDGFLTPGEY